MASVYSSWSKEDLIARVLALEASSPSSAAAPPPASRRPPHPTSSTVSSSLAPTPSSEASTSTSRTDSSPGTPALIPRAIRKALESQSRAATRKSIPFSDHPRRKIAFKLSYLGSPYCGLTSQGSASTPLPTVEGVLQAALEKAELIEPGRGWDGCQFARCGRTDRGVSAAGQVVSLWIKSRMEWDADVHEEREEGKVFFGEPGYGGVKADEANKGDATSQAVEDENEYGLSSGQSTPSRGGGRKTEFPYLNIINKILPPTIRLLAWSPLHPTSEFDARYSCSYRHYKYFFSLNATSSGPDSNGRILDLAKMREAASYLIGEHDFKNFCKVDGSKQITNYTRRIHSATISPVTPITAHPFVPSPYSAISPTNLSADASLLETQPPTSIAPGQFLVLDLLGRAFLYHQVRHIMAILFLVGAGLEQPTIVKDLLRWEFKPTYEMADGEPLLLWDCGFPEGLLQWQYGVQAPGERERGEEGKQAETKAEAGSQWGGDFGFGAPEGKDFILTYANLSTNMLGVTHSSHLNTLLHAHFHSALTRLHPTLLLEAPSTFARRKGPAKAGEADLIKSPLGGNVFKTEGSRSYPKLEGRARSESFEVANERYRARMLNRFGEKGKPKKTPYPVRNGTVPPLQGGPEAAVGVVEEKEGEGEEQ